MVNMSITNNSQNSEYKTELINKLMMPSSMLLQLPPTVNKSDNSLANYCILTRHAVLWHKSVDG